MINIVNEIQRVHRPPFFPPNQRVRRASTWKKGKSLTRNIRGNEWIRPSFFLSKVHVLFTYNSSPWRQECSQLVVEVVGVGRMWVSTLSPCSFHPAFPLSRRRPSLARAEPATLVPLPANMSILLSPSDDLRRSFSTRCRLIPGARVLRLSPPSHRID